MKENKFGGFFTGFAYSMLIPRDINGTVKSTAWRRSNVIVKSQIPISAFWKEEVNKNISAKMSALYSFYQLPDDTIPFPGVFVD